MRGYKLEDMIIGIWLTDFYWNPVPRFMHFTRCEYDNIIEFVENAIKETLEALKINVPKDLPDLVRKGYKLVLDLDKRLSQDAQRFFERRKMPGLIS